MALYGKWTLENPAFETLLNKTRGMERGSERAAAFQQMCGLVAETANTIPMTQRLNVVAYRSDKLNAKVADFESSSDYVRFISEFTRKDQ